MLETATLQSSKSSRAKNRSNSGMPMLAAPNADEDIIAISETEESHGIFLQTNSDSKGLVCVVCYRAGHLCLDCPCLSHLPAEQKEDIAVRRRQYYTENERETKSTWMGRLLRRQVSRGATHGDDLVVGGFPRSAQRNRFRDTCKRRF
jgi:hypothetical protein